MCTDRLLYSVQSTQTLQANVTYLLVAKVTKTSGSANGNSIALYVKPTTLDESLFTPLVSKTGSSIAGSLNHFTLRTACTGVGDVCYIDNPTISTSFAEVVPEPTGLLVLGGGALTLGSRRRGM